MESSVLVLLGVTLLVAAPFALWYYIRLAVRLRREGGSVHSGALGFPDLVMSTVLGTTLLMISLLGFAQSGSAERKPMSAEQVLPGIIFLLALAGGVLLFLMARRLQLAQVVNPRDVSPPRALGRGALMLLIALPVIGVANVVTVLLPREFLQEQELVTLFGDVSKSGNLETVLLITFAATIVAPLCEEFIFRGYFYTVWKRYLGGTGAALVASALFALTHVNIASLPGLFALAICLTLSFEATGSILVPIAMHALFNGMSLVFLYLRAQGMV